MLNKEELQKMLADLKNEVKNELRQHDHDGINSKQIHDINLFGQIKSRIQTTQQTIATTGNTDFYVIAPIGGFLESVDFSGVDALATSDSAYVTFTITNLGQLGTGTAVMLATGNTNTTKATGGSALSANAKRSLLVNSAINTAQVTAGDRLLVRAAATGTLANTVTSSMFILRFK